MSLAKVCLASVSVRLPTSVPVAPKAPVTRLSRDVNRIAPFRDGSQCVNSWLISSKLSMIRSQSPLSFVSNQALTLAQTVSTFASSSANEATLEISA